MVEKVTFFEKDMNLNLLLKSFFKYPKNHRLKKKCAFHEFWKKYFVLVVNLNFSVNTWIQISYQNHFEKWLIIYHFFLNNLTVSKNVNFKNDISLPKKHQRGHREHQKGGIQNFLFQLWTNASRRKNTKKVFKSITFIGNRIG